MDEEATTAMDGTSGGEDEKQKKPKVVTLRKRPPVVLPPSSSFSASSAARKAATAIAGAPGGPLLVPDYISPLLSVREFRDSCISTLLDLQADLSDPSIDGGIDGDDDILVDELKIKSDEEIVNLVLKEVLQQADVQAIIAQSGVQESSLGQASVKQADVQAIIARSGAQESSLMQASSCNQESNIQGAADEARQENGHASGCNPDGSIQGTGDKAMQENAPVGSTSLSNNSMVPSPCSVENNGEKSVDSGCSDANGHVDTAPPFVKAQLAAKKGSSLKRQSKKDAKAFAMSEQTIIQNVRSLAESLSAKIRMEREQSKVTAYSCLQSLQLKDERGGSVQTEIDKCIPAAHLVATPFKHDNLAIIEPTAPFEVVLWVQVLPKSLPYQKKQQRDQDFLVLGSQMLTALKDKICCATDELMRRAGTYLPSGYFFIENVFYNDLRDPRAIDYSSPLIGLMNKRAIERQGGKANWLSQYRKADMACTRFLDIESRIGMRYVYCHQGDCKHGIVIRDMRLIHKEDVQNVPSYPLQRSLLRPRYRKCSICGIYLPKKVTYDDKLAPSSPCYFCACCYYLLHYTEEGTLLYDDFTVYDYDEE